MTGSAAVADTFDAAAFDALPLRDKLDRAAHASLAFRMALIASTDVATATDARIKVALSAAQSILPLKVRINETEFHAKLPDRTAEHLARWEALKRDPAGIAIKERIAREEAARASRAAADAAMKERELKHDVIDGQPVVAGSSSAITGNS
jgi:hypothetical protein